MIDPHVHLRDWKQSGKETIEHGLSAARKAGITRVFDMPNTDPALTERSVILDRLALASPSVKKHRVSYSLYAGITNDISRLSDLVSLHSELFPLVIGLKMFLANSTGNMGITDRRMQEEIIKNLALLNYSGVLAVHAEDESFFESAKEDPSDWSSHSYARPAISESESVKNIIALCEKYSFSGNLHICHVSTSLALDEIRKAKERKIIRISCGATAHHALLTLSDAKERNRYLKMNPPLRSQSDRNAVYDALKSGLIDFVESDHAPHTLEDKERGAGGIPGFAGTLLLLDHLVRDGVDEERIKDLFGGNVLKLFNLKNEEVFIPKDRKRRFSIVLDEYPVKPFIWS